jgi:flagellar hook assembly protein FlgD
VNVNPNAGGVPPVVASLAQAYPNPMNPTATISYTVGAPGKVMLRVFDVTGRVIRTLVDETQATGRHAVIWDGSSDRGEKVASGVFFYQLEAPGFKGAKKIVILQ